MMSKNKLQDFDLDSIVKVDKYEKDLSGLEDRIAAIEKKFGNNESIAETLCDTAEKATKMKAMLAQTFVTAIKTDKDTKESLTQLVYEIDRSQLWAWIKRVGIAGWTIMVFFLGLIAKALIDKWIR